MRKNISPLVALSRFPDTSLQVPVSGIREEQTMRKKGEPFNEGQVSRSHRFLLPGPALHSFIQPLSRNPYVAFMTPVLFRPAQHGACTTLGFFPEGTTICILA
ncbi:MAG: hypothetical protein ABSE07_07010 [Methanoregula sp.]